MVCLFDVEARHCDPRESYRSAQDLTRQNPADRDWRRPQRADQLVEVLTRSCHFLKQKVDIPVPRNRGDHAGLQG